MSSEFLKEFLKLFDFLTVLDRDLIICKGLPMLRVRQKMKGYKDNKEEVEKFFKAYFVKQWCRPRMIPMWNYHGRVEWSDEM
jgi:hypothetical protein